jgi:SAM-dependent methyltransferase
MTDKTTYMGTDKPRYIGNLVVRMDCNEALAARDFEEWVFSHLKLTPGCDVMEVACGTGKALFKLLDMNPEIRSVLALDFADTAIARLKQRAAEQGRDIVEAVVADMETAPAVYHDRRFDHIYSIYGVHYSPRMAELLCEYGALLKPGGSIFVCGPDSFCNTALMRLLRYADRTVPDAIPDRMLRPFASESDRAVLASHFARVELTYLENLVSFDDVDAFLAWWENHDLYHRELAEWVVDHVRREITTNGAFGLNKNVLGITLHRDR